MNPIVSRVTTSVTVSSHSTMELVDKLCHLGDIHSVDRSDIQDSELLQ